MSATELYWIMRLDSINVALTMIMIIAILIMLSAIVWCLEDSEDSAKRTMRLLRMSGIVFVICLTAHVFLPSTKEMAALYVLPKIVTQERVQQAGDASDKLWKFAMEWVNRQVPTEEKK